MSLQFEREKDGEQKLIEKQWLKSSVIGIVKYDIINETLEVNFVGGGRVTYEKFPAKVAENFFAAPSPGKFYNSEIRSKYK